MGLLKTFLLSTFIFLCTGIVKAQFPPLEIAIDSVVTASTSGTIDVPVRAGTNWQNITTINGTISFDTTLISWNQLAFWGLSNQPGATFTYQGGGLLTYTWNSLITIGPTLNAGDIVFTLRFNIQGNTGTSPVDLVNVPQSLFWFNGFGWSGNNFLITNGSVTINGCSVLGTDTTTACDSLVWIDGSTYYSNNNTATFNIVGGAANGCDSVVTLDLTIQTVNDTTTVNGNIITANAVGAVYQWIDCDNGNTAIPGETNQSFTATTSGNYAVIITENGCTDTSACVSIVTVGMIENQFADLFTLHPNPTNGNFNINLSEEFQNQISITITDIYGNLVYSNIHKQSQLLNLSLEQPAGIYLLMIDSGEKRAVFRLVKN